MQKGKKMNRYTVVDGFLLKRKSNLPAGIAIVFLLGVILVGGIVI